MKSGHYRVLGSAGRAGRLLAALLFSLLLAAALPSAAGAADITTLEIYGGGGGGGAGGAGNSGGGGGHGGSYQAGYGTGQAGGGGTGVNGPESPASDGGGGGSGGNYTGGPSGGARGGESGMGLTYTDRAELIYIVPQVPDINGETGTTATYDLNNNRVTGSITLKAGNGGQGGFGGGGAGGKGGTAELVGIGSMRAGASLTATSGNVGANNGSTGGGGGDINIDMGEFRIDGSSATPNSMSTLKFVKTDGNVAATFQRLYVTGNGGVDAAGAGVKVDMSTAGALDQYNHVTFTSVFLSKASRFDGTTNTDFGSKYLISGLEAEGKDNYLYNMDITYSDANHSISILSFDLNGVAANDTLLHLGAGASINMNGTAFDPNTTITLGTSGNFSGLNVNDTVYLVRDNGGSGFTGHTDFDTEQTVASSFGLTEYSFGLQNGTESGDNVLKATFKGQNQTPGAAGGQNYTPYFEGAAATMLTVTEGGRRVEKTIEESIVRSAGRGGFTAGLSLSGGSFRNDTGSHVDVDSFGATLSLARQSETMFGLLTVGAFAEAGRGSYNTYNNLLTFGHLEGDGDTDYFGGGLFARHSFNGGVWLEASARAGGVKNDYQIKNQLGASYDQSTSYWGAHFGLGKQFDVSETGRFDLYGKLFWTRVEGDSFLTAAGEHVTFDDADSLRTRLGGRYTHDFNDQAAIYLGAAWEHEFDGRAGGSVNNLNILNPPESKGSSAFAELGLSLNPASSAASIDLSVFGSAGQQEGFGGSVALKLEF